MIARNPVLPAGRLSLPRHERPRIVPLTVAQVQAWAAAAPPRIRAMIIAQAALGLRISELRALRLADVDFLRREVRVEAQLDPAGRYRVPLKSANAARTVPLPTVASEALAGHIAQFPPAPDGTVFITAAGRPWSGGGMLRPAYSAAAAAAGLPGGTSSHDLRHHYASVLLAAGESVHAVAERIGDTRPWCWPSTAT
jgi:integrase